MRRRLLLVRHGVTDWNREGRFQGLLDPPLSTDGAEQARLLAQRLNEAADDRPARIVSSPLLRALATARAIADWLEGSDVAVEPDDRLVELGQGEWEGRTHAELEVEDAERYAAWRRASPRRPPPGGEPLADAVERVASGLRDILEDRAADEWPVCLVAHGGSLRVAARLLLDIDFAAALDVELDNASLSVLDRTDGIWRLVAWNDASHLLGHVPTHVDEQDGEPLAL